MLIRRGFVQAKPNLCRERLLYGENTSNVTCDIANSSGYFHHDYNNSSGIMKTAYLQIDSTLFLNGVFIQLLSFQSTGNVCIPHPTPTLLPYSEPFLVRKSTAMYCRKRSRWIFVDSLHLKLQQVHFMLASDCLSDFKYSMENFPNLSFKEVIISLPFHRIIFNFSVYSRLVEDPYISAVHGTLRNHLKYST